MLPSTLPPQAVAQALDVGRATLDHWIEEGWLPARAQAARGGGSAAIELPQVLRFVRRHHLKVHHPDALGLGEPGPVDDDQREVRLLLEALPTHHAEALGDLLINRLATREDLPAYLDGPVEEALARCREASFGQRGRDKASANRPRTGTLIDAAAALRRAAEFVGREPDNTTAVIAASLDDDRDPTPAALAALLAADLGHRLIGPGPTASAPAIARAAEQTRPRQVILSVARPTRPDPVTRDELANLTHRLLGEHIRVLLLGPRADLAPDAITHVRTMRQLCEVLKA